MKHFRKFSLSLLLTGAMLLCLVQTSFADGISVSAGQGSVSEGKTVAFSITVPSGSEAWTYSVSYSANLTLESGDLAPMGFEAIAAPTSWFSGPTAPAPAPSAYPPDPTA